VTDALLPFWPKATALIACVIIIVPGVQVEDNTAGIIVRFIVLSMFFVSGAISLVMAIISIVCAWVAFHVAARIQRSRRAESDDDVWIPPRSLLEKGFETTWRWPFYKVPEEQQDGYIKLESVA
jgi:hypothetical protein